MQRNRLWSLVMAFALGGVLIAGCARPSSVSPAGPATTPAQSATPPPTTGTSGSTSTPEPVGEYLATSVVGHDLVAGSSIALTFESGRLSIRAGCNSMSGSATLDHGQLQVRGLTQTEMGCDQALLDQDSWVAGFVMAGPYWSLSGVTLTLTGHGVVAESITLVKQLR